MLVVFEIAGGVLGSVNFWIERIQFLSTSGSPLKGCEDNVGCGLEVKDVYEQGGLWEFDVTLLFFKNLHQAV